MTFLLNQYNKKSFRSSAEKQRDERIYFRGTTQLGKCPTQFPVTVKSVCLYTHGSKQRLPGPFIQTAIPDFHLRRLPWMASIRTTLPVLWLCVYMSRVYHPRGMVSTGIEKVLRIDRPDGRRVRKFDGLSGRGLWWRLTPQILKSTSLSSFLPAHPLSGGGWRAQRVGRGGCMGRSAARVPIVQRLWRRLRPWAYLRCESSEGSKGVVAASPQVLKKSAAEGFW